VSDAQGETTNTSKKANGTDPLDVLEELDFSKLAEADLIQELPVHLRIGGRVVKIVLSNEGLQESLRAWRLEYPAPTHVLEERVIRSRSKLGKAMIAAGHTGPWPAIRKVFMAPEDDEEFQRESHEHLLETNWQTFSRSLKTVVRDDKGKLLSGKTNKQHDARIAFFKSKGMLDAHAVTLVSTLADLTPFVAGGQAGFFDEDSEPGDG